MRVSKYIPVLFLLLTFGCSRKINPEVITEVRDTVIYLPSDTVINTVSIRDICDTVFKRDTVLVIKRGRVENKIIIKKDSITFTCKEDSLRMVIETLRKRQTVTTVNKTQWTPVMILLLLFLIALIIGAVTKLVK